MIEPKGVYVSISFDDSDKMLRTKDGFRILKWSDWIRELDLMERNRIYSMICDRIYDD